VTAGELLVTVCFLVLPVALLIWLIYSWLARPRAHHVIRDVSPAGSISRVAQSATTRVASIATQVTSQISTIASAVTKQLSTISMSVTSQIGMVAHLTISACGYAVARLRGLDGSPVIRMQSSTGVVHAVTLGGSYELVIRSQDQKPESYIGANVNLEALRTPLKLGVVVEGRGLQVAGGSERVLEVGSGINSQTVHLRPTSVGVTSLRIDLYHQNAWVQSLDLALDVKADALAGTDQGEAVLAESLETSTTLPVIGPEPVARHLNLNLAYAPGEGRTYSARASNGDSGQAWRELNVPCREADLTEINLGLRQGLEKLRRYYGDQLQLPEDQAKDSDYLDVLDELARRGNDAFTRIFPQAGDRDYLLQALGSEEHSNLEIGSNAFFLPWELLYDPYDPKSPVDLKRFWGFRYHISRVLTGVHQQQSPVLSVSGRPRIAVFANPELTYALENEVPYFRTLGRDGEIVLNDWLETVHPENDTHTAREQRSAFFDYCGRLENDLAHFACHAVVRDFSPESYLALTSQLRVRLEDMRVEKCVLAGSPFVVLNACGTSVRDPSKTSDFVRTLMLSGSRGVLSTECDVPDLFASVFIQNLYGRILKGETVIRSLFDTRQYFLATAGNPLGLLYSAYLPLESRLSLHS
jgi:hypothetical protein